jgi:hypothetical protein
VIDAAGARPEDQRQRRRLFLVTLTALQFRYPPGAEPELIAWLSRWLGGWPGIGRITTGMARHGYDLQLTRYGDEGWRATFYAAGREHSPTAAVGSAWQPTPWQAVQRAAWETLRRAEVSEERS